MSSETLQQHGLPSEIRPSYSSCPITMQKNNRKYIATFTQGESKILQSDGSDVSLTMPPGTHGVYMTHVDLDYSRYQEFLNPNECIVGPFVDVVYHQSSYPSEENEEKKVHVINIPHIVKDRNQWKDLRVRKSNVNKSGSFKDLEQCDGFKPGNDLIFTVDEEFITIYTKTFSQFTCTACNYTCNALVRAFLLVQFENLQEISTVKLQAFICSDLYQIKDFRNVSLNLLFKLQ